MRVTPKFCCDEDVTARKATAFNTKANLLLGAIAKILDSELQNSINLIWRIFRFRRTICKKQDRYSYTYKRAQSTILGPDANTNSLVCGFDVTIAVLQS